jgi:hypothetical protein
LVSAGAAPATTVAVNCDTLLDVPEVLSRKWNDQPENVGNYCVGDSRANAGSVSAAICRDENLRLPTTTSVDQAPQCASAIASYRQSRIELSNSADRIDRIENEIESREQAIIDVREEQAIEQMRNDD